jgi:hypothetical protein
MLSVFSYKFSVRKSWRRKAASTKPLNSLHLAKMGAAVLRPYKTNGNHERAS